VCAAVPVNIVVSCRVRALLYGLVSGRVSY
jgi:hypothetical protein